MMAKIHPQLFELLSLWYGGTIKPHLPPTHERMLELWRDLWFSKKQKQAVNDAQLKLYQSLVTELVGYIPKSIIDQIGLVILWDQIPRNIFRGTPKAYEFDSKALAIARKLRHQDTQLYEKLPVHFKVTICICYLHSQSLEDQEQNKVYVQKLRGSLDKVIQTALEQLWYNHWDRMRLFGRIPERNSILDRESSREQTQFLQAMQEYT